MGNLFKINNVRDIDGCEVKLVCFAIIVEKQQILLFEFL